MEMQFTTNIVKCYFVYNDTTALRYKDSRFHKSEDIKIGLPEDLKNDIKVNIILKSILYATTTVYSGNRAIASRAGSNDRIKLSLSLILLKKY